YQLVVYNRSKHSVKELVNLGAEEAFSPEEVAQEVEVLITMLPDSDDVKKVILGENGAISGLKKNDILIDMSSISPSVAKEVASTLAEKGVRMLDAPVSGGERSEEHTSELQSRFDLVCRLLLEKKNYMKNKNEIQI